MKSRLLKWLPALLFLTSCNSEIDQGRWRKGILIDEFIYTESPFPSCHAATIAETPDGLIAAWFGGTHERHPDVEIWVSRRKNNQWTTPVSVANGIVNDTLRYPTWNPVLYQIPGGNLLLFYKVGPSPSTWKGMMISSEDCGVTWSKPIALPEGFIGPVKNKPVLLDDGSLLCPSSTEGNGWRVHFEITPDHGQTWFKVGPISSGKVFDAIQPAILDHGNGVLQALCRSKNAVIATAWSYDYGRSWGLLWPSGLPNNNSGIDAVALKDGRFLVVYNHVATPVNAKKGHRTPLNIALSDDGKHWNAACILEDSEIGQYSYPSVIQSKDGLVHIVYTWRRERIKYVQIDPGALQFSLIENGEWPEK